MTNFKKSPVTKLFLHLRKFKLIFVATQNFPSEIIDTVKTDYEM